MKKNDKVSLVKAHTAMTQVAGMLNKDADKEINDDVDVV